MYFNSVFILVDNDTKKHIKDNSKTQKYELFQLIGFSNFKRPKSKTLTSIFQFKAHQIQTHNDVYFFIFSTIRCHKTRSMCARNARRNINT